MLLRSFIDSSIALLGPVYPAPEARNIVLILCESLLGVKSYTHVVEPQTEIPQGRLSELQDALSRLCDGEPLQYVLGSAPFFGRDFNVNPSVLIPRPETELLVEMAVEQGRRILGRDGRRPGPLRILDLCTGSGCIAWTLALELPGSEVVALDISGRALETAAGQPFDAAVRFLRSDVLAGPSDQPQEVLDVLAEGFDIIVSNPPYIMESEKQLMRPNVLEHEPHLALFVKDSDPLVFYTAVASWCRALLRPEGFGVVEINEQLGDRTAAEFVKAGLGHVRIHPDLASKPRDISFVK